MTLDAPVGRDTALKSGGVALRAGRRRALAHAGAARCMGISRGFTGDFSGVSCSSVPLSDVLVRKVRKGRRKMGRRKERGLDAPTGQVGASFASRAATVGLWNKPVRDAAGPPLLMRLALWECVSQSFRATRSHGGPQEWRLRAHCGGGGGGGGSVVAKCAPDCAVGTACVRQSTVRVR